MSAVTVAELLVAFEGKTEGFDKANKSVQSGLRKTGAEAEGTAEAMLHLAAGTATAAGAYEAATVQLSTYSRVSQDASKASQMVALAMGEATKGAVGLESALDVATVAARSAATSFTLADRASVDLGIATAAARTEVQALGRSFGSTAASNYAAKLDAGSTAAAGFRLEVSTTNAQVAALNAQLAQTKAIGFPRVGASAGSSGSNGVGSASAGMAFAGRAISLGKSVGSGLTKNVTAPLLAIDALSLKVATDYDAAMAKVEAVGGVSTQQAKDWSDAILKLGPQVGKLPQELAAAMIPIASEGQRGAMAMETLKYSAIDAETGLGKTDTIARALVFAMHDYAASGLTAAQASDILVAATREGNFEADALAGSLGRVLPVTARAGISFGQTAAAIASITAAGVPVQQAVTDVVRVIGTFEKPSRQTAKALDSMRLNAASVRVEMQTNLLGALLRVQEASKGNEEQFAKVFGSAKAFNGTLSLLGGNLQETAGRFDRVTHAAGSSAAANEKGAESIKRANDETMASLAATGVVIGRDLEPALKDLEHVVRDVAHEFDSLDPQTRQAIIRWSLYAAATGPVIKGLSGIAGGVNNVVKLTGSLKTWGDTAKAASEGTGIAAEGAATKVGGLVGGVRELIGLAANPITISVVLSTVAVGGMAMMGKSFLDEADKQRRDTFKDYQDSRYASVHRARQILATGGQGALLNEVNRRPSADDYLMGRDAKPGSVISKADALQAERDAKNDAMYGQYSASRRQSLDKYNKDQAAKAQQEAIDAEKRRLAALAGGSGLPEKKGRARALKESQEAREQDQLLQSLKDRVGNLATAYTLLGQSSDAVSLKQEILGGEFASASQRATALSKVMGDLRKRGALDLAASDLYGKGTKFDSLGGTAKLKAEADALQLVTDKRKAGAAAAKEQADAIAQVIQKAKEEANQAVQDLADSRKPEISGKSSLEYAHEFARKNYGKDYASLGKDQQATTMQDANAMAAKDRDAWAKELSKFTDDLAKTQADALDKSADAMAKRAKDLAKRQEDFAKVVAEQNKVRDDANVRTGGTLNDQRNQFFSDALNAHPDVKTDLAAWLALDKASGEAFDAKHAKSYAEAVGSIREQLAGLTRQTDAARLAAIEYSKDGTQLLTDEEARNALALQKLFDQDRAFQEEARQAGDMAGTAFSDGLNAGMTKGVRGGVKALMLSLNKEIQDQVIGGAAKGFGSWVTRSMNAADPNKKAVQAATGKDAALVSNTQALVSLTAKLSVMAAAGAGGLAGTFGLGGAGASSLYMGGGSVGYLPDDGSGGFNPFGGAAGDPFAFLGGATPDAGGGDPFSMFPHFARGDDLKAGQIGVVGDGGDGSGSELIRPSQDVNIVPHDVMMAARQGAASGAADGSPDRGSDSGAGGGETHNHLHFNPNVTINGKTDRQAVSHGMSDAFHSALGHYLRMGGKGVTMVDLVVFPPLSDDGWQAQEDLRAVVGTVDSGSETRLQRDVQFRRSYSIPWSSMDTPARVRVRDFKRLRLGVVRAFLLLDVFECYYPNQTIGLGDGATKAFGLSFTLADAANSLTRAVRYPMPTGTALPVNVQGYVPGQATAKTLVTVAGAVKVEGTDFTVSPSTGVVTFASPPPGDAAIVATFWAYVPVRFASSKSSVTFKGTLGSRTDDLIEVLNE